MPKQFNELRERLLQAGIAPRHVRRYLHELAQHLADLKAEEERAGLDRTDAEAAALARLGTTDELATAMTERRQFRSFSARAPWAAFGFAPLFFLAAAYFLACFILWSGWEIFLPGANTPFIQINGLSVLYFGAGKFLYFAAPVLIGWAIELIAARQRLKAVWPIVGCILLACFGGLAQVHTTHPVTPNVVGHISMNLVPGSSALVHSLIIISLTVLPYLSWRIAHTFFSADKAF